MPIVAEAATAIRADFSKFPGDLKRGAQKPVEGLGASIKKALSPQNLAGTVAGTLGGLFAISKVVDFLGNAVGAASDLNETLSATGQILGQDALPELETWAAKAAEAFGQSKQQALDGANTFAIFGKSAGLAGDDLTGFSTDLVELAGDLASFRNTSPEEAITAIGAALRGESEPIRRYGVLLDDATLRQRALKLGIITTTKQALTPQQRVLAAQAEIFAQTADAQGDFARTSTGLANTQRINAAKLQNAMADLGAALLPIATELANLAGDVLPGAVKGMADFAKVVLPLAKEVLPLLATAIGVKMVLALANYVRSVNAAKVSTQGFNAVAIAGALYGQALADDIKKGTLAQIQNAIATKDGTEALDVFNQAMADSGGDLGKAQEALEHYLAVQKMTPDDIRESMVSANLEMDHGSAALTDTTTGMMDDITGAVTDGAEVIVGKFGEIPENGADAMLEQQWHLKDAATQLMDFVDQALSPMAEKAQIRGFLTGDALKDALHSKNPLVRQKAAEMRDAAVARFNELPGKAWTAGVNSGEKFGDGIVQGMNNKLLKISGKANDILGVISGAGSPWYTKYTEVGEAAGEHFMDALHDSLSQRLATVDVSATGMPANFPHPHGGAAAAIGGNNITVNTGSTPREKSMLEIVREMRRAEYLGMLTNG